MEMVTVLIAAVAVTGFVVLIKVIVDYKRQIDKLMEERDDDFLGV